MAFEQADGTPLPLSAYADRTILLVNMASKCRFRKQFAELEALYHDAEKRGLVVLGLPSNDFANQEPGDSPSILEKYRRQLGITFPVAGKVRVRGKNMHPFFARVGDIAGSVALPKWNFYKYLLNREGRLVAWYSTPLSPTSGRIRQAIDSCLE